MTPDAEHNPTSPLPSAKCKPTVWLDQWRIIRVREGTRHLVGIVSGHPRLREGCHIVTSEVMVFTPERSLAETLNTIYSLEAPGPTKFPDEWARALDGYLREVWGTSRIEDQ